MSTSVADTYEVSVSEWSGSCSKSPAKSTFDSMADPSNSVKTVESKLGEDTLQSGMQPNTAAVALNSSWPSPRVLIAHCTAPATFPSLGIGRLPHNKDIYISSSPKTKVSLAKGFNDPWSPYRSGCRGPMIGIATQSPYCFQLLAHKHQA